MQGTTAPVRAAQGFQVSQQCCWHTANHKPAQPAQRSAMPTPPPPQSAFNWLTVLLKNKRPSVRHSIAVHTSMPWSMGTCQQSVVHTKLVCTAMECPLPLDLKTLHSAPPYKGHNAPIHDRPKSMLWACQCSPLCAPPAGRQSSRQCHRSGVQPSRAPWQMRQTQNLRGQPAHMKRAMRRAVTTNLWKCLQSEGWEA